MITFTTFQRHPHPSHLSSAHHRRRHFSRTHTTADESEYHQTPWVTNTVPAEDEGKYEGKAAEDIFSAAGSKRYAPNFARAHVPHNAFSHPVSNSLILVNSFRRAEDDPFSMDAKQTSSTQLTISADHQVT
jgi:hypothetical protein